MPKDKRGPMVDLHLVPHLLVSDTCGISVPLVSLFASGYAPRSCFKLSMAILRRL